MTVSNNKDKLRWLINDDEEYESIVTRDEHSEKSNKNYDSTFLSKKIDEICENFLATNNFNVKTKNSYFNSIEEILLLLCKNVYNFVDVVGQLTVKKKINAVKDSNLLRFDIDASPLYKRDVFKFDTTCYTIPIKEDITKYLNDSVHLDENETQLSLALFLDEFNVSPLGSYNKFTKYCNVAYRLINIKSLKYLQSSTKKHFRSICVVQSVIASQNWEKFLSFICKQINFSVLINGIERYISLKFIVADNVGFADIYKIVKNYKSSCKQQNCKSCLWKGIEWSSKRTPNDISINLRKHSISYLPPNSNMCNDPFHDLLSNGVLYTATMLTLKNMLLLLPPLMSTDEIKNKLILEAKNRKFRNLRLVLFDKIFSKLTTTKRTSKAKNESHDVKSVNKCVNLNGNQTLSLADYCTMKMHNILHYPSNCSINQCLPIYMSTHRFEMSHQTIKQMLNSTKSRINVSKTIGKRLLFDRSIEKEDEPAKKNFKLDLSWDYDAFVLPDEEDLSEQDKSLSTSILEISRNLVEETKKYEERNSDGSDDNSEESSLYDPLEDSFDYLNDSNY